MAEDFAMYAVRNDRTNKESVLHRARLLLWAAVEESGDGVKLTAAQMVIQIAQLGLGPQRESCSLLQVLQEWTINGFGLDSASFNSRNDDLEPETGPVALATPAETLLNAGDGQRMDSDEDTNSTESDEATDADDSLLT